MHKALPGSSDSTASSKAQCFPPAELESSGKNNLPWRLGVQPPPTPAQESSPVPARQPGSCRRPPPWARCLRGNRRPRGDSLSVSTSPTCPPATPVPPPERKGHCFPPQVHGHHALRVLATPRPLVVLQGQGQCLPRWAGPGPPTEWAGAQGGRGQCLPPQWGGASASPCGRRYRVGGVRASPGGRDIGWAGPVPRLVDGA